MSALFEVCVSNPNNVMRPFDGKDQTSKAGIIAPCNEMPLSLSVTTNIEDQIEQWVRSDPHLSLPLSLYLSRTRCVHDSPLKRSSTRLTSH